MAFSNRFSKRWASVVILCLPLFSTSRGYAGEGLLKGEDSQPIRPVQLGSTPFGHFCECVASIAFAPEGNRIASTGGDHRIHIWDISTGIEQTRLPACEDSMMCLAYSPDGKSIASGGADGDVSVWDVRAGKRLRQYVGRKKAGYSNGIFALAWIDSGKFLVTASHDNTIRIWSTTTGALHKSISEPDDGSKAINWDTVAFHPGSAVYASCSGDTIRVCDLMTGKVKEQCGPNRDIRALAFSPDGRFLATVSEDGKIRVWDRKCRSQCCTCGPHNGVLSIAFSNDGSRFATASQEDGKLNLWRTESGELLKSFSVTGRVLGLASVRFSPSDAILAAKGGDIICFWDVKSSKMLDHPWIGHQSGVYSVAVSPDGRFLASAGEERSVLLWDLATRSVKRKLAGHSQKVRSVSFSPDGVYLASASEDQSIRIWKVATGESICCLKGHKGLCTSVVFSPDGAVLFTGSFDKTIRVWDVKTGQERKVIEGHTGEIAAVGHTGEIAAVAIAPNGKVLASCGHDHSIRLWNPQTGTEIVSIPFPRVPTCLSFSSDSTRIACGNCTGSLVILDATNGKVLCQTPKSRSAILAVAFAPDGKTVATAHSWKDCVQLWDTATGKLLERLDGHESHVRAVAFGPSGKNLVSGAADALVLLWDLGERKAKKTEPPKP